MNKFFSPKMKIWAHCLVYNEDRFIWYAIMSVVDFVDKVLIWDTGSTDKTVEIIKEIQKMKGDKVDFKEIGPVDKFEFTKMRQAMLDQSNCDWILILDGDEIWWETSVKKVVETIKTQGNKLDGIVMPYFVAVGDIYHYQEELAGHYQLLGRVGHLSLRAINRKIPGLHLGLPYGQEGYFDENNLPIQQRKKILFLKAPYFHLTHLKRSSGERSKGKYKYELGHSFSKNFIFPEVFYTKRPGVAVDIWEKRTITDIMISLLRYPLIYILRRLRQVL